MAEDGEEIERVLILQGGGSLGAYECGVYKALSRHGIQFDLVAGTSIGAVNASIIAYASNDPARDLERFWLDLANVSIPYDIPEDMRHMLSVAYNSLYGNPRMFIPRWMRLDPVNMNPLMWTYLYDIELLKDTLAWYIDLPRLGCRDNLPRLIITATDVLDGRPVVFDSRRMDIRLDHIVASAAYPVYGLRWVSVDGRYLWDGSLLSNTPLREVIDSSPKRDKVVCIVSLFPRRIKNLPSNILGVLHRARDILFTDKTYHNVKMSRVISRYLMLLKEMHDILMHVYDNAQIDEDTRERIRRIEPEYHRLSVERGAIVRKMVRIERRERIRGHDYDYDYGSIFEDADFSLENIRRLIMQGEDDAERVIHLLDC